ncbi:F-box incomplete domain containing protein [Pandoravirus quercus]|uniref:F-box incomplete domain containing protein n=2 Tax=Pandoravirus TaxID=2060084 RepID=A0A2U7U8E4_9VIRU|nr:F-box incomplete domain containing protein [Pandoravirus quercus]AVK74655.1 F-box incomplete domain containing protein [Pandoravirus quercus]QBZ80833.1 F-box incomplete domain containing protein [Pandoravirus celtis]
MPVLQTKMIFLIGRPRQSLPLQKAWPFGTRCQSLFSCLQRKRQNIFTAVTTTTTRMADFGPEADKDAINGLPEEILAHILATLPKGSIEVAARVCRRWRAAAIALADVGGARGPFTGRMGLRRETIDHAAGGGHKALVDWLREAEQSPWSQDTAVAALRGGHLDVFDHIINAGGTDVLGPRLAAASVAYGGTDLLERLERMGCPVDGWTLMVGAAVLPLANMGLLLRRQSNAPAHFVAALLGRTDLLSMFCGYIGRVKFTPALHAVLDPATAQCLSAINAQPWTVTSNQDSDRLSDALAARAVGLSTHAVADLLLDLQREGHVAWVHRGIAVCVGPQGAVGPRGPTGPVGCAGVQGMQGAQRPRGA